MPPYWTHSAISRERIGMEDEETECTRSFLSGM